MRGGDLMLVDELNLAEDSVIERLNSVLEKVRRPPVLSLDRLGCATEGGELDCGTAVPLETVKLIITNKTEGGERDAR